jgi:hypothetical protein
VLSVALFWSPASSANAVWHRAVLGIVVKSIPDGIENKMSKTKTTKNKTKYMKKLEFKKIVVAICRFYLQTLCHNKAVLEK